MENIKYPNDLPVLAFLATGPIGDVDKMIASGTMQTSWVNINKNMITNPEIQIIKILDSDHNELPHTQCDKIVELSKEFIK